MKKLLLSMVGFMAIASIQAQNENIHFANTIEIAPEDSKETIINKAAHIVPTPNQ